MDKPPSTPAERILVALKDQERSKAWLARNTRIPLTTLDRRLRGDGTDFTLAQIHSIADALAFSPVEFIPAPEQAAS